MLRDLFNSIPPVWRTPVVVALGLVVVMLLWFYGARAANSISSWWFSRNVAESQKEIQELKNLAADTLKQLDAEKQITAAERAKREIAETLLADKTKTANEKLKIYEEVTKQRPIPSAPASTAELCARARALGISCEPSIP